MERIGDDNQGRGLYYMEAAIEACEGVPVTIERGAVVMLANALVRMLAYYRDASEEWGEENQEIADGIIDSAEQALQAYYGDRNT